MATTAITVLIADPKPAVRATCLRILQSEKGARVVGEARNRLETITATIKLKPRILLLDFRLSSGGGASLLPIICKKSPKTRVILFTGFPTPEARVLKALSFGARGYLDRKALGKFLAKAVRVIDLGEVWVPRKMVAKILDLLTTLTLKSPKAA